MFQHQKEHRKSIFSGIANIESDVNLSLQLRNIGSIVHDTGNTKEKALLKTKIVKKLHRKERK